jgi:hypothetical protein
MTIHPINRGLGIQECPEGLVLLLCFSVELKGLGESISVYCLNRYEIISSRRPL